MLPALGNFADPGELEKMLVRLNSPPFGNI